jgi:hypothetical protein
MPTIISHKLLSKLPLDFDWKFYLQHHPDLQQIGYNTELQAVVHYVQHGQFEGRLYSYQSNIENIISETTNFTSHDDPYIKKIVLFTQFYQPNNEDILNNIIKCLSKNLNNEFIDYLCLFLEHSTDKELLPSDIRHHSKLHFANYGKRLSFKNWITHADVEYKPYIKLLANSDIYFDHTLQKLLTKNFNDSTLYAVTRKDLDEHNNITQSHDRYNDSRYPTNPHYSHDAWAYQNKLTIDLSLIDLDLGIGNCDRLFKSEIQESAINFINLYPEINAIHLDKRLDRGDRKSYDLNKHKLLDFTKFNIQEYLTSDDLTPYSNKLEGICLLVNSQNEISRLKTFCNKLSASLNEQNIQCAKNIDFHIASQYDIDMSVFDKIKPYFKSFNLIKNNIPAQYDHYVNPDDNDYGVRSGPNFCFFQNIELHKDYNTTLFLETDVFFGESWLHNIYYYCLHNIFWVSGAANDCQHLQNSRSIHSEHINGGVCLYATGNQSFQSWIKFCHQVLPFYVKHRLSGIPYDYLLLWVIKDFYDIDRKNRFIWQYILRQYIKNNLIYNYSDPNQTHDLHNIQKHYKYSLLHKKDT